MQGEPILYVLPLYFFGMALAISRSLMYNTSNKMIHSDQLLNH